MQHFDYRVFHENFEDHQAASGRRVVSEDEVDEVWWGTRRFTRNHRRPGTFLMEGLTTAGRPITVVVLATSDPLTWLIYTAW